jgi:hypothetical protein
MLALEYLGDGAAFEIFHANNAILFIILRVFCFKAQLKGVRSEYFVQLFQFLFRQFWQVHRSRLVRGGWSFILALVSASHLRRLFLFFIATILSVVKLLHGCSELQQLGRRVQAVGQVGLR